MRRDHLSAGFPGGNLALWRGMPPAAPEALKRPARNPRRCRPGTPRESLPGGSPGRLRPPSQAGSFSRIAIMRWQAGRAWQEASQAATRGAPSNRLRAGRA